MDERKRAALAVMQRLEENGFEAYLVGGCVRDELAGRIPQDYDVATGARPEQVIALFDRTVPTGIRHGTVTVLLDGIPVEVTTFRVEGEYLDRRRPSRVEFVTSLRQDLARRDFTFNAMAMDRHGRLHDYFGGREDLRAGLVRTVGDPHERFREDALRMVRAARFAAQFGFSVDPDLEEAMRDLRDECVHLSVERVVAELEKMWKAHLPSSGLILLWRTGLFRFLPPFHTWPLPAEVSADDWRRVDEADEPVVRWALFLALLGVREDCAEARLRSLKLSNERMRAIHHCLSRGQTWKNCSEAEWKRVLLEEGIKPLLTARKLAVLLQQDAFPGPGEEELRRWWDEMPIHSVCELAVNGKELVQAAGRSAGPWVGKALKVLAARVAAGELANRKEELIKEGCCLEFDNSE
jgi:tRNA nucleotidyltransferase (CCA-adding enzyme)